MFEVAIPSKGRAGKVKTHKLFPDHIIFCPVAEQKAYEDHHRIVVGVPNEIRGITPTRNFIIRWMDHARPHGQWVEWHIQIDDDAKYFYMHQNQGIVKIQDVGRISHLVENMFVMTEEWGAKAFGLSLAADKKFYREYSPFSTQSIIGSNVIGIIKNPIRFDEEMIVKEDYDYSLQQLAKYRRAIRFNKFGVMVEHLFNAGGCVGYRTNDVELKAAERLLQKWGPSVIKRVPNKNFVKVIAPLPGI